jgi:hypothetical protein
MEPTNIDKFIKVGAVFSGGHIVPRWFSHDNKKYEVKEVNYQWEDWEGQEKLLLFAVSDGTNSYEIALNLKRLVWKLNKASMGS